MEVKLDYYIFEIITLTLIGRFKWVFKGSFIFCLSGFVWVYAIRLRMKSVMCSLFGINTLFTLCQLV